MLLTTLINRPYVFIFLAAFLVIGIKTKGLRTTLLFLITGYWIAWASEALSIRTGFPYGGYSYIYENLKGELLLAGVPVWDSLSYTFLCFAGLSMAEFIWFDKLTMSKKGHPEPVEGWKLALLSAFFVTLLDIVIDPLANLGDRWFLGKIYYYPDPGFYFGVPLSNFAGWFLVSFLIVGMNLWLFHGSMVRRVHHAASSPCPEKDTLSLSKGRRLLKIAGPLFYFGIFAFNWGITLWLKEWALALASLTWILIPLLWLLKIQKSE